ncbi:hypothetical protein [Microvirga sp. KLBC 81]|uniref:hypothetical protein n=1 Tax=Microvirga sp. KLBC 81 TaxID=1862707 RepID=UPI001057E1B0|nr:hypothetical protein [Microvirga sp. KLBC 81]
MKRKAVDKLLGELRGLSLSHIWRGYGSAIFCEFGTLRATYRRDGSLGAPAGIMSLMIEWSWRIERGDRILCGSWSDDQHWSDVFSELLDAKVTQASLFGRIPEIEVSLSNGARILSFMTGEGLPAWTLFDRRGSFESWLSVENDGLEINRKL